MRQGHNPKLRLGLSLEQATRSAFEPVIKSAPPLPSIDYELLGQQAPTLLTATKGKLPLASTVVITWASAEWAALHHVFCAGSVTMPYSERSTSTWAGWDKFAEDLPSGGPSGWTFWGYYRLVEVNGSKVLLFKSNTHLDWPGPAYLKDLINLLIQQVKPSLILSAGTAGGAMMQDHIGTVRAVSAGTLYETGQSASNWPEYSNAWKANDTVLQNPDFAKLLFPVPITQSDLQTLSAQFNENYRTSYTLAQLDPNGLNLGDAIPKIDDQTGGEASLLTTSTFVVGTTAGTYESYASIEMDDAIIGEVCAASGVAFGFVRNISDPVQNATLPSEVQGNWGSAIYDACGFYTSYNGALAVWAMLS